LIVSYIKVAEAGDDPKGHYTEALEIAEAMRQKGILAPSDAWIIEELRKRLAAVN
jgi:hypothetical protein